MRDLKCEEIMDKKFNIMKEFQVKYYANLKNFEEIYTFYQGNHKFQELIQEY